MKLYIDTSFEWTQQCEHINELCNPINLKSFGVDKMERDVAMEFKVVQYMTQTQKHLKKLYINPDHFSYNRHSSIMTFDQNRVLLGESENKDSPDNYINANFVEIDQKKVIATQGPLHSTINNFWKMIAMHNVSAIFMLCERVEKQKVKCDLYWPTKVEEKLEAGDYEIKLISKEDEGKYIKVRKFSLENTITGVKKQLSHYQFLGWPDGDRPLTEAESSLTKLLNIMLKFIQNDEMVVVHCSAGVGRTGTLIAMAEIQRLIPKTEAISIFQIVRKLRQQRWAMVYTATQYEYLYQFTEKETLKFFQPEQVEKDSDSQNQLQGESAASGSSQSN